IVGILPEGFAGLSGKAELWIPPPMAARLTYAEYLTTPQNFISVVARRKPGVSAAQANAEMAARAPQFVFANGTPMDPESERGAAAIGLGDARVDATVRRAAPLPLGAAVCLLLVPCVNVASLMLARARMRRREMETPRVLRPRRAR